MDRRRFLVFAALAAGSSQLFSCRGATGEAASGGSKDPVARALARARALGKPLLVIAVPREEGLAWERGRLVGETLDGADDQLLSRLALCESFAATAPDLARQVGGIADSDLPWAWLVETDGGDWRARPIEGALPEVPPFEWGGEVEVEQYVELLRERNAVLAGLLGASIAADAEALRRRAAQSLASLTREDARALEEVLAHGSAIESALADRAAAPLVDAATSGRLAAAALEPVVEAARARWIEAPPRGAKWAVDGGCGCELEGAPEDEQPSVGVACGMAFVPQASARFLMFFPDHA